MVLPRQALLYRDQESSPEGHESHYAEIAARGLTEMAEGYLFVLFAGIAVGIINGTMGALPYNGWGALLLGAVLMAPTAIGMWCAY